MHTCAGMKEGGNVRERKRERKREGEDCPVLPQSLISPLQNGLTCPTCKKVYGIKTGDMPNGTMTVRESHSSLPGHEDCGSIEIVYSFSPGVHVRPILFCVFVLKIFVCGRMGAISELMDFQELVICQTIPRDKR